MGGDVVEVGERGGGRDRVAAEGGEAEGADRGGELVGGDHAADRDAVGEALGEDDHVRLDPVRLESEIGDAECGPRPICTSSQMKGMPWRSQDLLDADEVFGRRGDEAADTLDRLGDEGGRVAAGGGADHRLDVAGAEQVAARVGLFPGAAVAVGIADVVDVQRREGAGAPGWLAGGVDGGEGAAVVASGAGRSARWSCG